jgi:hypothetical protein
MVATVGDRLLSDILNATPPLAPELSDQSTDSLLDFPLDFTLAKNPPDSPAATFVFGDSESSQGGRCRSNFLNTIRFARNYR